MITKFKTFIVNETMISHETNELHSGNYLNLERIPNGNLKISLTDDGKDRVVEENINEITFYDYFEDISANSCLYYIEDISSLGFMNESPGITLGYYYDDNGNFTDLDNEEFSEVFYYTKSNIKNFTEELTEEGSVIFQTSGILTPEELEEFKINKSANKFNL